MNGQSSHQMLVELPPDLEQRVMDAAAEKGIPASEYIRDALLDALAREGSAWAARLHLREQQGET